MNGDKVVTIRQRLGLTLPPNLTLLEHGLERQCRDLLGMLPPPPPPRPRPAKDDGLVTT